MRKLIIILSLMLLPLMGGAALAASDSGIVRSVNTVTGMLLLSDGASYYVPNRLTLSRFKRGDEVRLVGFGTFTVSKRKASTGRNPRTGEPMQIKESHQPKFRAGKGLKDLVN